MAIALPSVTTYRQIPIRRFWSLLYILGELTLFLLFVFLALDMDYGKSLLPLAIFVPLISLFGFLLYVTVEEWTSVVTLESDQLVYRSIFKNIQIKFADAKGYRAYSPVKGSGGGMVIIVASNAGAEIEISKDTADQAILLSWLSSHFTNTSVEERISEMRSIMNNPVFGATETERQENLKRAKMFCNSVNVVGCAFAALLFFWSDAHWILNVAAVLYVPITIVWVHRYKGLVYFNNKTNSPHPYVGLGLIMCSIGLLFRGIFSYYLLDYGVLMIAIFVMALILTVLMLYCTIEFSNHTSMDKANIGSFFFFFLMYSYGTCAITNCLLDQKLPEVYDTHVTERHSSTTKSGTEYYVTFPAAGPVDGDNVNVSKYIYMNTKEDSSLQVLVKPGRMGIRWYYLEANN